MIDTIVHPFRQGAAERTRFGYLTDAHPRLDRLQNTISMVCGIIAALAIVTMVVLTLVDVSARLLFHSPLGWTVSFIETHLMLAAAFFGIVTAYRSGAHVAVTSLYNRFPPTAQKVLMLTSHLTVATGFGALFYAGLQNTLFAVETNQWPFPGSSELMIPTAVWKAYVPISAALGLVLVLIDLGRELAAPWNRPNTDYDPGDLMFEELGDLSAVSASELTESWDRPNADDDPGGLGREEADDLDTLNKPMVTAVKDERC
jgi:TRAP-type C4-dicarboxylate transport system permease small subunit